MRYSISSEAASLPLVTCVMGNHSRRGRLLGSRFDRLVRSRWLRYGAPVTVGHKAAPIFCQQCREWERAGYGVVRMDEAELRRRRLCWDGKSAL
jgi:hypothetical protein